METAVFEKKVTEKLSAIKTEVNIVKESMDDFLDKIIWYNKRLDNLNSLCNETHDLLIGYIHGNPKIEKIKEVRKEIVKIIGIGNKMVGKLTRSMFYSGVKTSLTEFRIQLSNFVEVVRDIDLRYESIPNNKKITSLLKEIKFSQ